MAFNHTLEIHDIEGTGGICRLDGPADEESRMLLRRLLWTIKKISRS